MLFCLFGIASIPFNLQQRFVNLWFPFRCSLPYIFCCNLFFFSHIDLSQCQILSKILWLKQDVCGMELPPPFLLTYFLITWSPPLNVSISIHKYYGDSSLYRSALHPYHPKTWTIEILKVVHVSCCFHKLVWIGTRTL